MGSENPSGADNQQERPGIEQWIVGFVDGEGCFSCPIQRNTHTRIGWQLQPRFSVVQSVRSIQALEIIQNRLGCGKLYRNHRHDDHREDIGVYTVFNGVDLRDRIVPFFEEHPLITAMTKRTELTFLVSVRVPSSPPGLRTLTLTSARIEPSSILPSQLPT